MNLEISNWVSLPCIIIKLHQKLASPWDRRFRISATIEASDFKFGMELGLHSIGCKVKQKNVLFVTKTIIKNSL